MKREYKKPLLRAERLDAEAVVMNVSYEGLGMGGTLKGGFEVD